MTGLLEEYLEGDPCCDFNVVRPLGFCDASALFALSLRDIGKSISEISDITNNPKHLVRRFLAEASE